MGRETSEYSTGLERERLKGKSEGSCSNRKEVTIQSCCIEFFKAICGGKGIGTDIDYR